MGSKGECERTNYRYRYGGFMRTTILSIYTGLFLGVAALEGCAIAVNPTADAIKVASPIAHATSAVEGPSSQPNYRLQATVQHLVQLGPRVAGTPAALQASNFLVDEFRQAGYETEVQTFTYKKFRDLGSTLTVEGGAIAGQALNNSIAGRVTARLVAVPQVGQPEDFAAVDVKGAIAVVRRGVIPFSQKAEHAANAGAIALIVVNSEDKPLRGTLSQAATIPVLGVASSQGAALLNSPAPPAATLHVNTQQQTVTGRNVIARLPGVTQPRLLVGGHYDSVAGSPGANDNASGTAIVLELARRLTNSPVARQTWFVAFDGEEDGLQGSRFLVNAVEPQFLAGLTAMLNFDMVGINDRLLISGSAKLRSRVEPLTATLSDATSGSSDHASFAAKGVPVLFFYRGDDPNYHLPSDRTTQAAALTDTLKTALTVINQLQ